jgi:glycerophosphoryl diester phosphodiesterase
MRNHLWQSRRPLLAFALAFQLFENFLFTPAMGFLGRALEGRPVIDSTELVAFFLSPRGFVILFLGATVFLTIRLVEHAGLSALVLAALEGKRLRPLPAFRWLAAELPRLARVGVRVIGWTVAVAAPLAVVAGLVARPLLARHDINYYLANRPPEFVTAGVVLALLATATLGLGLWLLVRWRLVVQACVFDRRDGGAAFREAALLSRGARWQLLGRSLAVAAFVLVLMLAAAALQQAAVWLALRVGSLGAVSLAVSFGVALLLRTVIGAAVTSFGACAEAIVFTNFYHRQRHALGGEPELPPVAEKPADAIVWPLGARTLVLAVGVGLLVAAGVSVTLAAEALRHERPTTVTAHRGGHHQAPENTAASIREAIATGAQYAEIDVQISKDGVLVVTHDSDFSRMGGVAKKVWDLTYKEIRAIPLGAKAAPEFRNEPAPTLGEVLEIARGHIGLNIELKYYGDHQPRLAERVVEAVRACGMTNQVVVQCLEYEPLMEVRRVAPEIPVGYLMSVNATHPGWLKVDFLSVELARVTGAFVRAAHRRGQAVHVWTVDKPADMERMIAVGADALITNEPAEALRRVREHEGLSQSERTLRRVHAWLAH